MRTLIWYWIPVRAHYQKIERLLCVGSTHAIQKHVSLVGRTGAGATPGLANRAGSSVPCHQMVLVGLPSQSNQQIVQTGWCRELAVW